MFDGPAMLDAMRRDANAKLTAGDDETERLALSELEQWKARAPAGGCASSILCGINTVRLLNRNQ